LLCGRYVHSRHPLELGGIYFFVNALKSIASWFVAAALYSRYFVAGTTELGLVADMNASAANYSGFLNSTGASFTVANTTGAIPGFSTASHASNASATAAGGAIMDASKIGDLPLFATVGALAAVWLIAIVALSCTIKREYLHTFVSLQTGYADSQSYFLDNQGNDARRVVIFFCNERHWQAIRDRVRQWVLSVYAAWQALMPAFFTADLQARIPDDFMPAQVVQDLNSVAAELDGGVPLPMQLPIPPSVGTVTTNGASILAGSDPMDSEPPAPLQPPPAGP
jgi:hypothetical protein